ncbi:MAG TPA: hypothetical protein VFB74_09590 [Kribbellaceae bacterium]|nr:hypothetical protein [Kribbellaceae bacterium]
MAQLDDAVQAYRASLAAVDKAKQAAEERIRAARERAEAARLALADAMVRAALDGTRQRDIIAVTGYSREQVRTILRAGGVEPE